MHEAHSLELHRVIRASAIRSLRERFENVLQKSYFCLKQKLKLLMLLLF